MTTRCAKHDWNPMEENDKKVSCGVCGTEQYIARLTPSQKQRVAEKKALGAINRVAAEVGITRESLESAEDEMPVIIAETAELQSTKPKATSRDKKVIEEPTLEMLPTDLLMWIGGSNYETPEKYIQEARKMGACKRVPMLPRGVVVGKTKVVVAHSSVGLDLGTGKKTGPAVFGYFTVMGIVMVVKPGTDLEEEFKKRGVEAYEADESAFGFGGERECGSLQEGGTYLISEEDMTKMSDLAESSQVKGQFIELESPIPIESDRFRGYKHVDSQSILGGEREEFWFEGAHEVYLKNKSEMRSYKRQLKKFKAQEKNKE